MTTLPARTHDHPARVGPDGKLPLWALRGHAAHFKSKHEEFDACKLGMWLFLTTEILLFAGIFVAYGVYRMLYPEAFVAGSGFLNPTIGLANTIVLLVSSWLVVMAVRNAQLDQQKWLRINLALAILCGIAFLAIKFSLEYYPKWSEGKRPGVFFDYPFAVSPYEPIWWGIYYAGTAIHAFHVIIGGALLGWCLVRSFKQAYGPTEYTMVEMSGLYWHLVDVIWIFLFPLLYLIH